MNVVIIPEDSRYDRLILEPILTQLFISLNKKNTRFYFDDDARRRGVSQTLDVDNLKLAIARFKHLQGAVVLLIVDRDGHNGRSGMTNRLARLANLKKAIGVDDFFPNEKFFAVAAVEELEAWVLAGIFSQLPRDWNWKQIQAEISVKEIYFDRHAKTLGLAGTPDGGRKILGMQAAANLPAILDKCEELKILAAQLKEHLS